MKNGVAVPNPSWEDRVNNSVYCLKSVDIRVCPGGLRGGNLLHDEADELLSEVLTKVWRKVLNPRKYFHPFDDPWEGEDRELGLPKLDRR